MSQLPKVFVRHVDAEEKLKICFTYGEKEKNFVFMRPKEEKLDTTISRMKLKMQDVLTKKYQKKKKKSAPDENNTTPAEIQLFISLLKNGKEVNGEVKNVEAWTENTQLNVNESAYEVTLNPPTVLALSLPKSIMAGFPVYPKVELEYCSEEQCSFSWYRSISEADAKDLSRWNVHKIGNENLVYLSDSFFYITAESDLGCRLRVSCLPKCGEKIGLEVTAASCNPVEAGPSKCPFEDRHKFTKERTGNGKVRCISYNILADCYADSEAARNDLFPYCPLEALELDYRKQLYLKEIIGYNGDIICLQEVDRKVFHNDLVPVLTSTGLEGHYSEKGGQVIEGLSCFYRTSKFKLIETHAIILSEAVSNDPVLKPILSKLEENEKLKEKFMSRTTALQAVLLESLEVPHRRVLVANTHLYFHPLADNIRVIQGASCVLYLENILKQYKEKDPNYTTSLIFSGDFNSSPGCGIDVLVTQGKLAEDCIDWLSHPEEIVPGMPFQHSMNLDTACGRPEYTNYTEGFNGCLDYLFYDTSNFDVVEVVPLPTHEQVTQHKALPSKVFPSDHIALICTLEWK
ncbi:hypothetical protein JTE90_027162 [Oedothorax gibbosus]|uniref:2',5'-phosphodiesterase 12 n=1 Tax=Oedothorax gibbosus TaxID=931172 RepID=A0AAV6TYD9_9ARAC|nr:hypothetical protein JTE90_027162 [Oedothorax gibbosus]